MKITILLENTACQPQLFAAHGLSIYLETEFGNVLVDTGPADEFIRNARLLEISLKDVDFCVISHGHDDHGGGLHEFLKLNSKAPVYISRHGFEPHFAGARQIGLDRSLETHPQIRLTQKNCKINDHLQLLSEIRGNRLMPAANAGLLDSNGPDAFLHEQVLLAEEKGRLLLLGGCAHTGIVNILDEVHSVCGRYPDVVISGFHLAAGGRGQCMADEQYLDALSEALLKTGAMFYTCHCTGPVAFAGLKSRMEDHLEALSTGAQLTI